METDQQMLVEEKEKEETNKKQTENKVKLLSPFQQKHMRNATGFIGVRKARGGKFGAEIKDPTTKKCIWLGTFNTAEEASNAFLLKKQEFLATHQFVKMPLMLEEKEKEETNKKQTENKVKFTPFQHNYRGNVTGLIGVNKRKNGKFGAAIRDPITKKTVWLGTFNTAEEASNAYLLKKQEFLATLQSVNKPSKGLLGTQRLQSGRYGARITDPFSHKEVWLGTFDTVEDASQAYLSKKSEFEKLVKADQGKEPIICVESSKEALCLMANVHGTKSSNGCIVNIATSHPKAKRSLLGIRRQKNGWNVHVVKDLIRSKKVLLGTSDTVVADSETYFSKKSEFEKLSKGSKENKPKNCDHISDQTIYVGRNKTKSQKTTRILGVRKRESGRYSSEICDRISNKLIWLGMFDTAEEASQAFQSKKLEIQKLVNAKQQCNLKTHSSARAKQDGKEKLVDAKQGHETVNHEGFQLESGCGASSLETDVPMSNSSNGGRIGSHEISHSMGVQKRKLGKHTSEILLETLGTVEEAFNAYQCKKSGFQVSKKAEFQTDKPTDSSAGENQVGKEDEDLWKGQWVQLPGNKEVNVSLKLGVPIIDNYGYLLGEFRSLDDLRIVKH